MGEGTAYHYYYKKPEGYHKKKEGLPLQNLRIILCVPADNVLGLLQTTRGEVIKSFTGSHIPFICCTRDDAQEGRREGERKKDRARH